MTAPNNPASQRISVVDCLRGFAVAGIIIIHFLEHLNFYVFPEQTPFELQLWDTVMYLGASKMYAIFALLFGLSCYIQHHNQERRGYDFRPRFAWRMVLLFGWGLLDLVFFNGDVLITYAALGLFLLPLVRARDAVLWLVAAVLFCQPVELWYLVGGLIDPETQPMNLGIGKYWGIAYKGCAEGSLLDLARANLSCGMQINFGWALENGRLTQTLLLFVIGMLLGRKRLFLDEGKNLLIWKRILAGSVLIFAVTQPLVSFVPQHLTAPAVAKSTTILLTAWRNFGMMMFYVSGLTLLYYRTPLRGAIGQLKYIGKMSLTNYLLQSIVGGFIFYHWGLELYRQVSHGYSFLLSLLFLMVLHFFCRFWTTRFRRGPLEEIWHRLTWVNKKI